MADRHVHSRPVRAIVLDFNVTLVQDNQVLGPLYIETFASVGVRLPVEEYHRDLAALPDREVFELALARAGLPADESHRDALVLTRVEGYLAAVASVQPIDDAAIAFVKAASERVALAIVSGAIRREIDYVLDAAGRTEHFPVVVSIDDVTNGKPDPEGFVRGSASSTKRCVRCPRSRRLRPSRSRTPPAERARRAPLGCEWRLSAGSATTRPAATRT